PSPERSCLWSAFAWSAATTRSVPRLRRLHPLPSDPAPGRAVAKAPGPALFALRSGEWCATNPSSTLSQCRSCATPVSVTMPPSQTTTGGQVLGTHGERAPQGDPGTLDDQGGTDRQAA